MDTENYMHEGNKLDLYSSTWNLLNMKKIHERSTYSVMDLIGDLGGVVEILLLIFVFFIAPISEHSFKLAVANRLFWAKTKDKKLFRISHEPHHINKATNLKLPDKVLKELNFHRDIHLHISDSIKLFLYGIFSRCYCKCLCDKCFSRRKKL